MATLTVSTGGTDNGDCTGAACATIDYALTQASATDTITINDGTYSYTAPLVIPVGVNVTSTSQDSSLVTLRLGANYTAGPCIKLESATPGTSGNQRISHITFDGGGTGSSAPYSARFGVRLLNRDDVRIDHCKFQYFNSYLSASQGDGTYALEVRSTSIDPRSNRWWDYVTTTMDRNSTWTNAIAVDNFQLDNNVFYHCGVGSAPRIFTPAFFPWLISNSSWFLNVFDQTHTPSEAIWATAALLYNVDIYKNRFIGYSTGRFSYNNSLYLVELWDLASFTFRENTLINGHASLTVADSNYSNRFNLVDVRNATLPVGVALECMGVGGSIVGNIALLNPSAGQSYGMDAGLQATMDDKDYNIDVWVIGNIIHGAPSNGVLLACFNDSGSHNTKATIHFMNNLIANCSKENYHYSAVRFGESGLGDIDFYVQNNIWYDNYLHYDTVGIDGSGDSLLADNNLFNTETGSSTGITFTNSETTAPSFTNYGAQDFTIANESAVQVNGGDSIGIYELLLPTSDFTGGNYPVPMTGDPHTYGFPFGPFIYLSGMDTSGPSINNKSPSDGHQYASGTTSAPLSIDASDPSGMAGVKWDTMDIDYASMANTMSESSGTYTDTISGLSDDQQVTVYAIARDLLGNDTSFTWTFSVAATFSALIVDDADPGYGESGTGWKSAYRPGDAYNDYHRYSNTPGDTATFTFTVSIPGTYTLYAWIFDGYHDTAAALSIEHAGGTANTTVDMIGPDGGTWLEIGTYDFAADSYDMTYTVATAWVIPDAMKLELVSQGSGGGAGGGAGVALGGGSGFVLGR